MRPAHALGLALLLAPLPAAADWSTCSPATHGVQVSRVIAERLVDDSRRVAVDYTRYSADVTFTTRVGVARLTLNLPTGSVFKMVGASIGTTRVVITNARGAALPDATVQAAFSADCYKGPPGAPGG